jgi:hypothetical protein
MRKQGRKTDKFGCFYRPQYENVTLAIEKLRDRYLQILDDIEFTPQEIMDIYVHADWQEKARFAYTHFQCQTPSMMDFILALPDGKFTAEIRSDQFKWAAQKGFKSTGQNMQYKSEATDKMAKWCTARMELGIKWGMVDAVFRELAYRCRTPYEVRYFWPAVLPLLNMMGDKYGEKLRVPRGVPDYTLPRELRDAAYEAQVLVSGTLIMPEPKQVSRTVRLSLEYNYPRPTLPWTSVHRMNDGILSPVLHPNAM